MSVTEGLEVQGVSAPDAFAAALEAKGVIGAAEGGSSSGVSVADGLVFGPSEGSTEAPAAATEPTGETATEESTETTPLEVDPDVAAYLARFQGDPDKALKAAVEADKMIGRQGNELGTLKSQVDQLSGRLEQLAATPPAPASVVQLDAEQIDTGILEYGGTAYATRVANEAPQYLDAVLARWGEDEPYNALVFRQEYVEWQAANARAAAAGTPVAPDARAQHVDQQIETQRMEAVLTEMSAEPAFAPTFDAFKDYLLVALEQSEPFIQAGVASDDINIQRQAVRTVFKEAQVLATKDLATKASPATASKAAASKLAATVITGQLIDPAAPKAASQGGGDADSAEALAQFKSMILGAPSTSVKDGLVVGK
jgi:hypothetical protein